MIFNQFEEFGNPVFHYNVTGPAIEEVFSGLGDKNLEPPPMFPQRARPARSQRATSSRQGIRT